MDKNNTSNVATGKPKVGGAIFRAPKGTALPTSATAELDSAFVNMGYISEDGYTNNNTPESDNIKAWGGDIVYVYQSEKSDEFGMTFIESLNPEVLRAVYGDSNVTVSDDGDITVKANSTELEEWAWVIDTVLRGSTLKRTVIPCAKITEVGEITYADEDLVGYETTIQATPDEDGNTHYEYIHKSSSTTTDTTADTTDTTDGD